MIGLQLRGHTCGPDRIAHVRSEMGFDVCGIVLPPNPVKTKTSTERTHEINIYPTDSARSVTSPVDPAGPHCYRDGTKTC